MTGSGEDGTGGRIIGLPSVEVEDEAETRQGQPLEGGLNYQPWVVKYDL